jgi:hypothetical protein
MSELFSLGFQGVMRQEKVRQGRRKLGIDGWAEDLLKLGNFSAR